MSTVAAATLSYLLLRYSDDGESSLGLWFRRDPTRAKFQSYTLEDGFRVIKVVGETRIPARLYELKLRKELTPLTQRYRERYSWFSWHVEIVGVPGFTSVYVHVGNKDKDTDACVLMGDDANNNQVEDGFIGKSVNAYKRWYEEIVPHLEAGGRAFVDVCDEKTLLDL